MATATQCQSLLCERLSASEVEALLSPLGFADWCAANRCLLRLADDTRTRQTLTDLLPHFLATLSGAADPDRVLVDLERFAHGATDRLETFEYLASNPRAVEILVTLFAGSQFLTEILLRNPEYFERLMALRGLAQHKSVEEFYAETRVVRSEAVGQPALQLDALRRFQRWELLRIGACDLLGLFDLQAVTAQLSNLADSLVRACLVIASEQSRAPTVGFAVIGMGKLGGQELNYSSDIDLLFVAASNADDYQHLGERLIEGLTRITAEGFLYRVDMRLRPWGRVGPLVTSFDGHLAYLEEHARQWEKQALLKARSIAGDGDVGEAFLRQIEPLVYGSGASAARTSAHAMKQRTEAYLREQGRDWGEVKLGEGSIRDIEFVVQYLQLAHGVATPEIRSRNTLDALRRLAANGFLSAADCRALTDGYVFLRTIEHHLQMMHYRQAHALPDDAEALSHLARRLGFRGEAAGDRFITRYEEHRTAVRAIYLRYLGGSEMKTSSQREQSLPEATGSSELIERMDASYTDIFAEGDIERHAELAARLNVDRLVEVDAVPVDGGDWRVTIVAYDYPGELSLICGLMFAYGLSIVSGDVFTYEPSSPPDKGRQGRKSRKIVDVFTVRPTYGEIARDVWDRYADDLGDLLKLTQAGEQREAQGELVRRVATILHEIVGDAPALYPVEIAIDNEASEQYTVLHIDAPDTIGFLYELTNALALNRVYIARVVVRSAGDRAHDTLYVTDAKGKKIATPEKQRELRAATVLIKHFTHLLPHSPDPESALLSFRGFVSRLFQHPNWPDELASLDRPEVLNALARLLGVSEFLWDDFLRMQYANLFPVVRDVDALETAKSREQLQAELEDVLETSEVSETSEVWRQALNDFKDREMLRIDMRHIMRHTKEFWDFSEELTDLAEVVANSAYHLCHEDLRTVYGSPLLESGELSDMAVCALGKCGGRELGFASDIELMFIYAGNGQSTGPQVIATSEFYEKLVQIFVSAIYAKREGIFEIDLRLRPYGKAGSMAVSMEAFRRYFALDGPAWPYERQALVKLRPIAGNPELGQEIAALRDAYVYTGEPFDATAMRAMRERQVRHLVAGGTFNAKFSPGGLVDVEYLVQGLQITHGHDNPALRLTNIREAMAALAQAGVLSDTDYARLRKAHTFLRWLIDGLRMVHGNARDLTVPPYDSEAFAFLARRLRYGNDTHRLREELTRYTSDVQELSARLLA
jgi:glutamate-ammonia-ligase adenylyltransferase